jgi:GH3 auxin-responsive promoter
MARLAFRARMQAVGLGCWLPVAWAAQFPERTQERVLRRILGANRRTEFGTDHSFSEIQSGDEYRTRIPVQDYDSLRRYIDRQRLTGEPALTEEAPLFYAQTSGSTGTPKYIPIPRTALRMHRAEQALFTYLQYRVCPAAFDGEALGIMGAAVEGRLDSGHNVGSVSGHLYESLPSSLRARFVLPPRVSTIADYELKYLVILRLALASRDITYLGSPNPSTFLRLLDVLNARRDVLARSLESGTLPDIEPLDDDLKAAVRPRLQTDRARATQLRDNKPLTFADLWPGIRLVTTWTGGACGIALDKLREALPPGTRVMELGYQSTECRGTMALEAETPGGLPPLHHHFFEFAEQNDWDNGRRQCLGLQELEEGGRYYVIVTTAAGLYRYFMNDIVEVTGRYRETPLLRFVQKGRGVTNLTGEKLYEAQVIEAVQAAARHYRLAVPFFIVVADEERTSYHLFLESDTTSRPAASELLAAVDERLGELNIEYQSKRASGRLAPLTLTWLQHGAGEAYKTACVRAGQREGQFKPAVLQYRRQLPLPIERYAVA